ncbi:3-demethylubiquinone-9 3-methyltransferase [Jeotgalicoccus saudimassiliensis]|uniref:3-demethylubiquinone-9 3-methyltransferase n=1 Tax=Jeotgalicoccus saudimassiliensis TaxID=1461582 RepID=A0A078M7Q1_9STAP|nr:VOC family protein [Jeotgalicoccus saudimassiliensis]CEA02334.1 3-demethylubiquinone-9 3-methyltransferase [Jeotgalicoccus saudimassiliensis]
MNYQKIVPHLWFDKKAVEAAQWYTSIFPNSEIIRKDTFKDTPSGQATQVVFKLMGYEFMALSAGPYATKNPSISFIVQVNRNNAELVDKLYKKLKQDGKVLMPLDKYPFNDKYAWVEDKYGTSWQLWLRDHRSNKNNIVPSLMFANDNKGKAKEATELYVDTFKKSEHLASLNYPPGMEPDTEDMIMHGEARLFNKRFSFNDSGHKHDFDFSEGVSLLVKCDNQKEIDKYWEKLSAVPEAEECGWLKDKFGVSWQIVPKVMDEMLEEGTPEQIARVTQAFLKMKKFDIETLEEAYNLDKKNL